MQRRVQPAYCELADLTYTNVVRAGSVWVAGDAAGTLTFYPDDAGRRIHVSVRVVQGTRYLEASLSLAVVQREPAAMERIDIEPIV